MEAYSKVYDSVTSEHLIEESYIDETWGTDPKKYKPSEQDKAVSRFASSIPKALGFGSKPDRKGQVYAGPGAGWVNKPADKPSAPAAKPAAPAAPAARPAATPAARPAATPAARPAATTTPKPAATSAAKPAAPAAPAAKPMSAMDQWAKANPKLAQAQKIRQQGGSRAEVNKALYNKGTAAAEKTPTVVKAGVDIFDLVKGYLLDEGYADSEDAAMVIMVNMSEEWKESILESYGVELGESSKTDDATRARIKMFAGKKGISFEPGPRWDASANRGKGAHLSDKQVEKQRRKKLRSEEYMDEAQGARENPEDHDKEEKKKYEKVRGEKTPMPPRGDKRREDFEKWYRANVR
jgi:hypothetical protein